jgi:Prealbumin-like fold domain
MTERVLGPTGSPRRRKRLLGLTALIAAAFAVFFVVGAAADQSGGCDFSPANNGTASCNGPLSGSTFAGGDGNLAASPTNFGTTDWSNVSGRNGGVDLPSGTGDNSFGQGSKTDDPNITVVSGSIPPNKSDLTRFYEASEVGSNNHNFLYLAWERSNVLGTANFNFEINKLTQPNLTVEGKATLARSAGDLLVTYDFDNGGGRPTVALLRWVTSASVPVVPNFATNACFSANAFPCWGDKVTLDGTDSIAAVNNLGSVTDPIAPNAPRTLAALTFGETAIDLTGAGVFPAGTCQAFGSAMVTGRSSSAFTSEIKDFIAPIPVNISNCGEIKIIKHSDPRGLNQDFSYTSTIPASSSCTADTTPASFTLNDNGLTNSDSSANTEDCTNVPAGSYTVTEGAEPTGFTLESLTCTTSGGGSGSQDATTPAQANITVAPGSVVTCTYQNQGHGALKITKSNGKGGGLNGATFSISGPGGYTNSVTTATVGGVAGVVCLDNLAAGDYTVTETAAPSGYAIDNASGVTKTVSANGATCSGTFTGQTFSFSDSPLSDIQVRFRDGGSGITSATISCDNSTGTTSTADTTGWDDTTTVTGIHAPTTVKCTIVIDP